MLQQSPVTLLEIDLSRATGEKQSAKIDHSSIRDLISGRQETAFLALLSPTGELVYEFKPSQGAERIAQQVRSEIRSN